MLAKYLTEIEYLINGRPLILINEDVNDVEALTPNHFLFGRKNPTLKIKFRCHRLMLMIIYDPQSCLRLPKWLF